jgi:hypothetical protein
MIVAVNVTNKIERDANSLNDYSNKLVKLLTISGPYSIALKLIIRKELQDLGVSRQREDYF